MSNLEEIQTRSGIKMHKTINLVCNVEHVEMVSHSPWLINKHLYGKTLEQGYLIKIVCDPGKPNTNSSLTAADPCYLKCLHCFP